jgi:large subunit ribosomal protein L9
VQLISKIYSKVCTFLFFVYKGIGHEGEKVSVRPAYAYEHLILPKLAVYASPEMVESMKNDNTQKINKETPSSITALQVLQDNTNHFTIYCY